MGKSFPNKLDIYGYLWISMHGYLISNDIKMPKNFNLKSNDISFAAFVGTVPPVGLFSFSGSKITCSILQKHQWNSGTPYLYKHMGMGYMAHVTCLLYAHKYQNTLNQSKTYFIFARQALGHSTYSRQKRRSAASQTAIITRPPAVFTKRLP